MAVRERQPAVRRVPSAHDAILGDVGPDSDYDIMVIVADDSPPSQLDEGAAISGIGGYGRRCGRTRL
jgi:hypothetical protein